MTNTATNTIGYAGILQNRTEGIVWADEAPQYALSASGITYDEYCEELHVVCNLLDFDARGVIRDMQTRMEFEGALVEWYFSGDWTALTFKECECGENVYECDEYCCGCGREVLI